MSRELRQVNPIEDLNAECRSDRLRSCVVEERLWVDIVQSFVSRVDVLERFERRKFEAVGPLGKESAKFVVLFRIKALDFFGRDVDVERRDGFSNGLSSGG